MASYTVKAGDSWASIAGNVYGNQRWLVELAKLNGGLNRMLHPGDVIDAPDFDMAQQPVITNADWAAINGQAGGTGPAVPSFQPPAVPSFTGGKSKGKLPQPGGPTAGNVGDPYSGIPQTARSSNPSFPTAQRGGPAALPPGTGYGSAGPTNGVPGAARQTGGQQYTPSRNSPGPHGAMGPITDPYRNPAETALGNVWRQTTTALGNAVRDTGRAVSGQPRPGSPATTAHNNPSTFAGSTVTPQPGYNSATPGQPPATAASDMSNIAWAARYTGAAIQEFGRTGNRNQLPNRISARVANELPFRGAGFNSIEEFMQALGYRIDADGNWSRYDPQVTSGYRSQTYTPSTDGGGGGGGGGGLSRGLASGYGDGQLVQWRISG